MINTGLLENDLQEITNDIKLFESNIDKIRLFILFIENHKLINIKKNKINTKNNILSKKELLEHIKNTNELNDYKINYILKFTINKSQEKLREIYETSDKINLNMLSDFYKLDAIKNIDNISTKNTDSIESFTGTNSLIIIANKEKKFYVKNTNYIKNNSSRKKR
jgi:hypothetical protein